MPCLVAEVADCIYEWTLSCFVIILPTAGAGTIGKSGLPFRPRFCLPGGWIWFTGLGLGLDPYTVSFATLAASSVSTAMAMALVKVSSSSFILKRAFRIASLLTEHMKRVWRASSNESLMRRKSQVTAS